MLKIGKAALVCMLIMEGIKADANVSSFPYVSGIPVNSFHENGTPHQESAGQGGNTTYYNSLTETLSPLTQPKFAAKASLVGYAIDEESTLPPSSSTPKGVNNSQGAERMAPPSIQSSHAQPSFVQENSFVPSPSQSVASSAAAPGNQSITADQIGWSVPVMAAPLMQGGGRIMHPPTGFVPALPPRQY